MTSPLLRSSLFLGLSHFSSFDQPWVTAVAPTTGTPRRRSEAYRRPHRVRSAAQRVSWASAVLVVGDEVAPLALGPGFGGVPDRQMRHEVVGGGAVPVPLLRWGVDGISGAHHDDLAAAGLDQSDAFSDVQCLSDGVAVPRRTRTGRECTALTRRRDGSSPFAVTSNQTSPVNISAGPFVLGCLRRISNSLLLLYRTGWSVQGGPRPARSRRRLPRQLPGARVPRRRLAQGWTRTLSASRSFIAR
jgi:hypothetical protein